jgi:hypothetical protein
MSDAQIKTLAKQLVKALAPILQSVAELSELKRIGEKPTGLTHGEFQTWMSQRGVSLSNGHNGGDQFL